MSLAFLASIPVTVGICFATYSNGLALLAVITTITLGILAKKKGH